MEGMTVVGKLRYKNIKDGLIGEGSYGHVFVGYYESIQAVAIKRISNLRFINSDNYSLLQEVQVMLQACSHPNILRYVWTEMNDDYVFIATELCAGTLHDWIEGTYKGPQIQLDERKILHQVTKGLAYLHLLNIVHRDMKPNNILIFAPKNSGGLIEPLLKIADFGFSKLLKTNQKDFSTKNRSNPTGTIGWIAPECYASNLLCDSNHPDPRYNLKLDIFPLGCIFGYTLSKWKYHPFGDDPYERTYRIKKRKTPNLLVLEDLKDPYGNDFTMELIKSMIAMDPKDRPTAEEVLKNEFFKIRLDKNNSNNECMTTVERGTHINSQGESRIDSSVRSATVSIDSKSDAPATSSLVIVNNTLATAENILKPDVSTDGPTLSTNHQQQRKPGHLSINKEAAGDQCKSNNGADVTLMRKTTYNKSTKWLLFILIFPLLLFKDLSESSSPANTFDPILTNEFLKLSSSTTRLNDIELTRFIELVKDDSVDVNAIDIMDDERNSLHKLCRYYGHNNLVDLLLPMINYRVVDISTKDTDGWSPLQLLLRHYYGNDNLLDLIQIFIANGADINEQDPNGRSPLLLLCRYYRHHNLMDLIHLFIERGADINEKTPNGWNPLHVLCDNYQGDNLENLILLLKDNNIDLKATTNEGFTASYLCETAFDKRNLKMSQRLSGILPELETKAKVDPIRTNEFLLLSSSTTRLNDKELTRFIELVQDDSVDVNATDIIDGRNSLHKLCRYYGHNNLIDLLLPIMNYKIIDISTRDPEGWNSFQLLCRYYEHDNLLDLLRSLIERGVDINDKTPDGWNPFHLICRYYRHENIMDLVLLFIERGANINQKNPNGLNPLHLLCDNYQGDNLENLILLLKDNNIDLKATTNEGFTASYLCQTAFDKRNLKMSQRLSEILANIDPILTNGM